jgi:hypothetical protein
LPEPPEALLACWHLSSLRNHGSTTRQALGAYDQSQPLKPAEQPNCLPIRRHCLACLPLRTLDAVREYGPLRIYSPSFQLCQLPTPTLNSSQLNFTSSASHTSNSNTSSFAIPPTQDSVTQYILLIGYARHFCYATSRLQRLRLCASNVRGRIVG